MHLEATRVDIYFLAFLIQSHLKSAITASNQASVRLTKRFQRRRIKKKWPIRKKNWLWRPCLLTDREEMYILYREPSIDASFQVSVHLAKRVQRRILKCEKLTDDGWQTTDKISQSDGKISRCLWQSELMTLRVIILCAMLILHLLVIPILFMYNDVTWCVVNISYKIPRL